ncbi:hypothetical protein GGR56DRAFT_600720 [Xylariaceae sp. FL0804]|nr:hypothetical protein GGR56DRAFT_600720 [Xylariaceae sp. FL0804]
MEPVPRTTVRTARRQQLPQLRATRFPGPAAGERSRRGTRISMKPGGCSIQAPRPKCVVAPGAAYRMLSDGRVWAIEMEVPNLHDPSAGARPRRVAKPLTRCQFQATSVKSWAISGPWYLGPCAPRHRNHCKRPQRCRYKAQVTATTYARQSARGAHTEYSSFITTDRKARTGSPAHMRVPHSSMPNHHRVWAAATSRPLVAQTARCRLPVILDGARRL